MNKYTSEFEANISIDPTFTNERFYKLIIKGLHYGENPNKFYFEDKSIENAIPSLPASSILAHQIYDTDGNPQHGSHDKHVERDNNGVMRIIYDEIPIGFVPNNCEPHFVEQDGLTYLYFTGYVWKKYANYSTDIILRDKTVKVSCEIHVTDGFSGADGLRHVKSFYFEGITLLGNNVATGMKNTRAKLVESDEDLETVFSQEFLDNLNKEVNDCANENQPKGENAELEKGQDNQKVVKPIVEPQPENDDKNVSANFDGEGTTISEPQLNGDNTEPVATIEPTMVEPTNVENDEQEFSLYSQIRDDLRKALPDGYYVVDFTDTHVIYEYDIRVANKWEEKVEIAPYTVNEGTYSVNLSKAEECVRTYITKSELGQIEAERTSKDAEFAELKQFKEDTLNKQRKESVDAIFALFDQDLADVDSYKDLKENNVNFSLEDIEMRCNAIWGKVKRSRETEINNVDNTINDTGANFSQSTVVTNVTIDSTIENDSNDGYGGIVSSYYEEYRQKQGVR